MSFPISGSQPFDVAHMQVRVWHGSYRLPITTYSRSTVWLHPIQSCKRGFRCLLMDLGTAGKEQRTAAVLLFPSRHDCGRSCFADT